MKFTFTMEFFQAAGVRAIRTFCQTAVTMLTIGQAFMEVNWLNVISISLTASIISILTAIGTGIPEGEAVGTLNINTTDPSKDTYKIDVGANLEGLGNKKKVMLNINAE